MTVLIDTARDGRAPASDEDDSPLGWLVSFALSLALLAGTVVRDKIAGRLRHRR